ncbi:MAG TPA: DNA-directed RNA polymerase subunit beta' [Candidatus Saccharibacteria bacterium]|nr:DNA-directed RNA polymerase subunit beta' [Candidatus Saccharibacteria bacterium]
MKPTPFSTNITDFDAVRLVVASPSDIIDWSYGEVTKPETINYRTQKPERDGLFCERIFGPVKNINPHDAKYKGVRSREAAVDKNGELVTNSIVRRERMGHINLAAPVAHIWFLRGTPSPIGLLLNITVKNLERIVYFASYVITSVDVEKKEQFLKDAEAELEAAKAAIKKRFEDQATEENADVKALAEAQSKEIDEVTEDFLHKKQQLESLVKCGLISETDYRNLPDEYQDIAEAAMGGVAIQKLLDEIDLAKLIQDLAEEVEGTKGQRKKKLMKRLKMLESMLNAGIEPGSLCVSVLPVIPPDLRPMVQLTGGRFATSDMNDLYRRVINRNNRLKKLMDLNAPEVIRRNEQRMLQEAVDALIDNSAARSGRAVSATGGRRRLKSLSDMLKGKQGRFRQNLLGKRVDYSGRSVIVSGPELTIDQCGLPKLMALELFKPFVIGWLMQHEYAHNIKSATRLIEANENIIWDALDEVIKNKYVLLNRAPTLHRLSILAFQPKLIEGKAIQLHPLVCKGFNADFDGDQMAVHLPLSSAAQKEARELMTASKNLLKPADGSPILHIEQDIVLGCYYLTYEKPGVTTDKVVPISTIDEAIIALDADKIKLQTRIRTTFRGQRFETTAGRLLFNSIFPEDFEFQNDTMTKKKLTAVMGRVFAQYGSDVTAEIADELKRTGFSYATFAGISTGMDDYIDLEGLDTLIEAGEEKASKIADQFEQGLITEEERYRLTVNTWRDVDAAAQAKLVVAYQGVDTGISIALISGARGSISQIKQVSGMKGMVVDAVGREVELPIRNNYKKGLTPIEYFVDTRGSRKGLIDIALRTADSGYLTRRMVDVAQDVFTIEEDGADTGLAMSRAETEELGMNYGVRLSGRFAAENVKVAGKTVVKANELITEAIAEAIDTSDLNEVRIRSVLSATNLRGISPKSYGIDMATGEVVKPFQPVGVIAAQSVGEPGTQLTMRTKHTAGAALSDDVTQGLPRVEELLEARAPKSQAFLSEITGSVAVWEEGNNYIVQVTPTDAKVEEIALEKRKPQMKNGQQVLAGDVIAADKDASRPLVAPFDATVDFHDGKAVLTAHGMAPVKYEVPGFKVLTVADGDSVVAGDRLSNGSLNLHDLMRLQGIEATQRYIINEILGMFAQQGVDLADQHLEIIVRQMFSRVQIEDSGDSLFVTGDIVSKASVVEENAKLVADGKTPAEFTQLLLGIAKVSTWSDSFLSAASFQDTTRVLINAATSGRVDNLYGLKENVIIGRKIPVGTGVIADYDVADQL